MTTSETHTVNMPSNSQPEAVNRSLYTKKEKTLAFLSILSVWVVIGILICVLLSQEMILVGVKVSSTASINDFVWKLEYVIKWSILPISWLVIFWHVVALTRGFTDATNPMSGNEHLMEMKKNILTNSMEQFVIFMAAQMCLVSWINGKSTQVIIPLINILFVVGRILFWLGYPKRRSAGMAMTLIPSIIISVYCLFQLLSNLSYGSPE